MTTPPFPTSPVAFIRTKEVKSHLGQLPHFIEGETKERRDCLARVTQLALALGSSWNYWSSVPTWSEIQLLVRTANVFRFLKETIGQHNAGRAHSCLLEWWNLG